MIRPVVEPLAGAQLRAYSLKGCDGGDGSCGERVERRRRSSRRAIPGNGCARGSLKKTDHLIARIEGASDLSEFDTLVNEVREVYGVDHAIYFAFSLGQDAKQQVTAMTYDQAWTERYFEQGYDKIDPVVLTATNSFHPFQWKELDWSAKPRRNFLREAVDAGVGDNGYVVPIRGPNGQFATFVINKRCADPQWESFIEENRTDFLLVGHYLHQKAVQLGAPKDPPAPVKLSPREIDVISMIASGLNRSEIAHRLSISENTIRVYIDSARHKLNGLNTAHAVAIAISRGLVNL